MPSSPFSVYGVVKDTDGSTLLADVDVFVFNKTKNEFHHGSNAGFENLTTNSVGEYQVNLGSYTVGWDIGDKIFITARNGNDTVLSRVIVAGAGIEQDLTMETLEPLMELVKFLRTRITDTNSTRDNTASMIMPDYPRNLSLTNSDYPRVSVQLLGEEAEQAGITSNGKEKVIANYLITVHVLGKKGDADIDSVGGDNYEGTRLLRLVSRDVVDKLRQRMLLRPSYDRDPHIQNFYAYQRIRMEPLDFNEEEGIMHEEIEIGVEYFRQT